MNNYYDEILEKINLLISEKKFKDASKIINDELNIPYVPSNFKKELINKLNSIPIDNVSQKTLSFNSIIEMLENNKVTLDKKIKLVDFLEYILLSKENIKDLIDFINFTNINNSIKSRLCNLIFSTTSINEIEFSGNNKIKTIKKDDFKNIFNDQNKNIDSFTKENEIDDQITAMILTGLSNQIIHSSFPEYKTINGEDLLYLAIVSAKIAKNEEIFHKLSYSNNINTERLNQLINIWSDFVKID